MDNNTILLIYRVGILFFMMIPGIIMKKCKLVPDGFGKGISNLVLYIAQPALIFLAYLRAFDKNIFINCLWVFLFSVIAHALFAAVALLCFRRAPDGRRRMLRMTTIFSNAAFLGIPLISAVLGAEATLYATVYNITFNLVLWSLGVFICTVGKDTDADGETDSIHHTGKLMLRSSLRALIHPVTIAAAIGLIFFFLPIHKFVLPADENSLAFFHDGFAMLRDLVAPLSMIVIGLRLADMKWRGAFKDKHLYLFLALRHLLLPLAVFGVLMGVSLLGIPVSYEVKFVVLILAAAPAASSATMFAERFDCDATYASRLVTISTVLSIVTMPIFTILAQL